MTHRAPGARASRRRALRTLAALLGLAIALTVSALPSPARADGDPASDYLWSQSVYVPMGTPASQTAYLQAVVAAARARGLPVKVAVIGSIYDLGSITPLWRRPQGYARFLGAELANQFHGLLLVAMPNGFGLFHAGGAVTSEQLALHSLRPLPASTALVAAASLAVRSIAAADGHPIATVAKVPGARARGSSGVGAREVAAAAAGALALAALAAARTVRRRRRRRCGGPPTPGENGRRRRLAGRSSRAVIAVAAVVIAPAGLAAVGTVAYLDRGARASTDPTPRAEGFTWPAGKRPAPSFALEDQSGHRVTPRSGGRRLTILAFVDPVCRALCPLEAAVLRRVEQALPTGSRPAIVAVSVDPWGDDHANLIRDINRWQTGPSWRWAVGSRTALERVWHAYQIGVQAKIVRVAGTNVHEISHDEMIYVIDGNGYERVLWPWPFTPAELIGSIHRLQGSAA